MAALVALPLGGSKWRQLGGGRRSSIIPGHVKTGSIGALRVRSRGCGGAGVPVPADRIRTFRPYAVLRGSQGSLQCQRLRTNVLKSSRPFFVLSSRRRICIRKGTRRRRKPRTSAALSKSFTRQWRRLKRKARRPQRNHCECEFANTVLVTKARSRGSFDSYIYRKGTISPPNSVDYGTASQCHVIEFRLKSVVGNVDFSCPTNPPKSRCKSRFNADIGVISAQQCPTR